MRKVLKGTSILLSVTLVIGVISIAFAPLIAHAETFSNVSEFPDFDMDCYVADLFTTEGHSLNKGIELELNSESTNKIMKNSIESNSLLMGSMTAWQAATFEASDVTSDSVTELGYYESIILSSINTAMKSSRVKDIFDNAVIKDGKMLFSSFKDILKTEYYITDFSLKTYWSLSEENQSAYIKSFGEAFKKQYPKLDKTSDALKIFNTVVKAAKSFEECMNNYAAYAFCSLTNKHLTKVINDLYEQCPDEKVTLKAALLNISSACTSIELDFGADALDAIYRGADIVFGVLTDGLVTKIISAHPVGLAMMLGRAVGKTVSNILFSADAICENYYKMCCFDEFEKLVRSVTRYEMGTYTKNKTNDNANNMFWAIRLMYNINEVSCDLSIDYAKTIYEKSIAGVFLSDEEYNNYVRTVNKIREYKQHDYASIMSSYVYYLEEDYPEIYVAYMKLVDEIENPIVKVESLRFLKKEMEIGLDDEIWFFWNNAEITPFNATNKIVNYYSSDDSIVSIVPSNTLMINTHKIGTATITAISEDGSFSDQLIINVVEGHGADGVYFKDLNPLEDYTYKIGETFSDTFNTYKIISQSTVGVVKGQANFNGVIIIPENVAYKNKIFTVTRIEDGKINGTGAFGGAFSNGNSYMNYKTYVSKVILPDSLTYIGNYAFMYLPGLREVRIPEGVTNLGVYLFDFSNVNTLYVPSTILSLGLAGSSGSMASRYNSFRLKDVYYNGTKEMWDKVTEGSGDYVSIKSKNIHFVHSHSFSKKIVKEPSCTENGITEYTCICGETYFESNVAKTSHTYVNGICTVCGAEDSQADIYPNEITLNKNNLILQEGQNETLLVTVIPNIATNITWSSSNTNVATVSDGTITANSLGSAKITAKTSNGLTATCTVTVTPKIISVTGVTLNKSSLSLIVGESEQLTATITPNNVTDKSVSWYSHSPSIASVSSEGVVTALTPGTAIIKARTANGVEASCYITVNNILWTLDDGTLTIRGNGPIEDYAFANRSDIEKVVIKKGITSIGEYAFYNSNNIVSVSIGNNVKEIGLGAFFGCTGLASLTIPDSVTSIGDDAFYGCEGLTRVSIPDSMTSIGWGAFDDCSGLKEVHITDLSAWCNISFSNYVSNPLYYAHNLYLNNRLITELVIPDSVTNISIFAFENCTGLTSVTISDSVTSISKSAFEDCTGLTRVTIPDSVTNIGDSAFENCADLTSVTIPTSVTSIGNDAFSGCTGLKEVHITDLYAWCNVTFSNYTSNPLYNAHNFYLNNQLITNLVIPDSVTSIGNWAFYSCESLTSITIPNSVTSIGDSAFEDGTGLTGVTIPDSVTSIGDSAFYGCTSLTSITIPNSVTSIGDYAFYDTAWYDNQPDGLVYAGKVAYEYKGTCPAKVKIKAGTLGIAGSAFAWCMELKKVTIPDSVTYIGDYAFYDCTGLTSVTIPDSITSIGEGAFTGCTGLTSVTIGNSVTSIGYDAFSDCISLTSVTIPDSVTSIGENAFGYYYEDNWETKKIENFTIYGRKDSAAETYAKENSFTFVEKAAPAVLKGDLNGDGKVNGADAGILSRYTSDWKGYADKIKNMDAADINGDGKVNGADAGLLSRYTSGWESVKKYFTA